MRLLALLLILASVPASACEFYSSATHALVGSAQGASVYKANGKAAGSFSSMSIYKTDGSLAGRIFGGAVYSASGKYLAKVNSDEDDNIVAANGARLGFARDCSDQQAGAGALLLLLRN